MTQWANNLKVANPIAGQSIKSANWTTTPIGTFQPLKIESTINTQVKSAKWTWNNAAGKTPQTLYSNSSTGYIWG